MNVHILAVGGIGMSGIARMIMQLGHRVSGFDMERNYIVEGLVSSGLDFRPLDEVLKDRAVDVVVRSTAIGDLHPELKSAVEKNIPVYHRAEMLNILVREKKVIGITGAHGKTTSTAMLAWILFALGRSPTAYVGGIIKQLESNAWVGAGQWAVLELDESDGTFSLFEPEILFVPSLELEHIDFYGTQEDMLSFFQTYFTRLKSTRVLLGWHSKIGAEAFRLDGEGIVSSEQMRFVPSDLEIRSDFSMWVRIYDREKDRYMEQILPVIGRHNLYNLCGVLQVVNWMGIDVDEALTVMREFPGVSRRMEVLSRQPLTVIHDYAHHPTEIETTLSAVRDVIGYDRRMVVVFEPHRYSRFSGFWQEFLSCFDAADVVLVTPVYSAGEAQLDNINSDRFAFELQRSRGKPSYALIAYDLDEVSAAVRPGDCLVVLGAGKVVSLAKQIASAWAYQNN